MKQLKTLCVYHEIDLDGWCSAAIVKRAIPEVQLVGWNYGKPVPKELSDPYVGTIVMVDVCLDPKVMGELSRQCLLIWIDHHISAIKKMEEAGLSGLPGLRNDKYAACELTWEHFFPEAEVPWQVWYLGMYDSFRHKGTENEKNVLYFQYAARAHIFGPESCGVIFGDLFSCEQWLQQGFVIYEYLRMDAFGAYSKTRTETIIDGHKCCCINKERFNPVNFGIDYHGDGYDLIMSYHYADGQWNVSLYNDNGLVDVSQIASARGGGGHKGAAGFRTNDIRSYLDNSQ